MPPALGLGLAPPQRPRKRHLQLRPRKATDAPSVQLKPAQPADTCGPAGSHPPWTQAHGAARLHPPPPNPGHSSVLSHPGCPHHITPAKAGPSSSCRGWAPLEPGIRACWAACTLRTTDPPGPAPRAPVPAEGHCSPAFLLINPRKAAPARMASLCRASTPPESSPSRCPSSF